MNSNINHMQVFCCNLSLIMPQHKKYVQLRISKLGSQTQLGHDVGGSWSLGALPHAPQENIDKDVCDSACPTATRGRQSVSSANFLYAYSGNVLSVPDWPSSTNLSDTDTRKLGKLLKPLSKQCVTRNFPNTKQKWQATQLWRMVGPCSHNGEDMWRKMVINLQIYRTTYVQGGAEKWVLWSICIKNYIIRKDTKKKYLPLTESTTEIMLNCTNYISFIHYIEQDLLYICDTLVTRDAHLQ
jgi:hypothetical protein